MALVRNARRALIGDPTAQLESAAEAGAPQP